MSGKYTGNVAPTFEEFLKRGYAVRVAREMGIPLARCATVGDSRSDLPLFESVGFSVAFNASAAARDAATIAVGSTDLWAVVPALQQWISAGTPAR